jgi:SAM-dependent methyltransferase
VVADLLQRELPEGLDPARLLEVDDRAAVAGPAGSFDFVLCHDPLRFSPDPAALLSELWRLAASGGVLLLEAEVLPGSEHSAYARFVPPDHRGPGWVPGRLALRWLVESCGFDLECWLGETDDLGPRAALRAIRSDRDPVHSAP